MATKRRSWVLDTMDAALKKSIPCATSLHAAALPARKRGAVPAHEGARHVRELFPNHHYYWGDQHNALTVGPERAERKNACATALANGVPLAIHSDAP